MPLVSEEQRRLTKSGVELVHYPSRASASSKDFLVGNNVIFVHGLTADCGHLESMMSRFAAEGKNCFGFNYPCFDGIDFAAAALFQLLAQFEKIKPGCISSQKATIVGHSMGGLVARAFVGLMGGNAFADRVITLGSPHNGTLTDTKFLAYLLSWAQNVRRWTQYWAPPGDATKMRSIMQLTAQDDEKFLNSLCEYKVSDVTMHSISGGHEWLEFCSNSSLNAAMNAAIRKLMKGEKHDGLVAELSSDLTRPQFGVCAPKSKHFNRYVEYHTTNHSNLVENQTLALQIVSIASGTED